MAKDERLNEEAARNPKVFPMAKPEDLVFLNRLTDEEEQLPKDGKEKDHGGQG